MFESEFIVSEGIFLNIIRHFLIRQAIKTKVWLLCLIFNRRVCTPSMTVFLDLYIFVVVLPYANILKMFEFIFSITFGLIRNERIENP